MLFSRSELRPLLQRVSSNDPTLTSLHLSHKKITNKQLLQISDALQANSNVTEVWLTNNQISDDANGAGSVGYLAGVLENNDSVGEVYLGGNKIGAKGASSIAALLQRNRTITDIGLEDNAICDGGAKMLADALAHNSTLQTLKLQGNDIQTEGTLKTINELLKRNRESAKKRFEAEHPELVTHKLKKPEEKKKKRSSRSRSDGKSRSGEERRSGGDGKSRSDGERRRGGDGKSRGSGDRRRRGPSSSEPRPDSDDKRTRNGGSSERFPAPINGYADNGRASANDMDVAENFLTDRKKSLEEARPPNKSKLVDRFKTGLGLGGSGAVDDAGMKRRGMKGAAFV